MMKSDAQLREEIIRDLPETTDLVERLRAYAGAIASATGQPMGASTMDEAADTITALQARVAKLEGALGRIESEGQQSADVYGCANCNGHAELARAALAEDYCGIVEVNEEDFKAEGERG